MGTFARPAVWIAIGAAVALLVIDSSPAAAQESRGRARQAYAKAIELEEAGNHGAALSLLWEAAGLAPDDPEVQNRLGEALARIGVLDAAVEAFQRAVNQRPDFPKASNNLILTLSKAGRGPEAVVLARKLVARSPDDPGPLFTLGLAQAEQDVEEAIATFRRVLTMAPRHTLARYNLALALRRTDALAEALNELDRLVAIERRPEAFYTIGVIRWHQGDLDAAIAALRTAIDLQPRHAESYDALGAIYKQRRDYAAAARALQRASEISPDQPAPRDSLGLVLQLDGRPADAMRAFAEAEELRRRVAADQAALMWTTAGIAAVQAGDPQRGLDYFRRATSESDAYAPAHYQLGLVLERLGDTAAARIAFARAQALNPNLVPPRIER